MQNSVLTEPFFVFTTEDVDFDQTQDLILFDRQKPGQLSRVQLWNTATRSIEWEENLPGIVDPATIALFRDDFYESSILVLGTQPESGTNANVMAFELVSGALPQRLWSQPVRAGLTPQRVAIGKSIEGEDTAVIGFRSINPTDTQSVRTVTELTLFEGRLINEVVLPGVNCLNLSVSQLDDDEELEIVFLDGRNDFHRLDFSQNRDLILTVNSSQIFVGSGEMAQSLWPENTIIQKIGSRISIHPLSENLDPYGSQPYLSLNASLIGHPILGDTNGNHKAEILFITESNGIFNANRLGYLDLDIEQNSGVEEWIEFQ